MTILQKIPAPLSTFTDKALPRSSLSPTTSCSSLSLYLYYSSLFYNKLFQEIVKKFRVGEKQQEVKNEGSIKINEPNKTTKQKGKCCGGNSQGSTIDKK